MTKISDTGKHHEASFHYEHCEPDACKYGEDDCPVMGPSAIERAFEALALAEGAPPRTKFGPDIGLKFNGGNPILHVDGLGVFTLSEAEAFHVRLGEKIEELKKVVPARPRLVLPVVGVKGPEGPKGG